MAIAKQWLYGCTRDSNTDIVIHHTNEINKKIACQGNFDAKTRTHNFVVVGCWLLVVVVVLPDTFWLHSVVVMP